ncbi:ribonuclease 1-like [Aristolochia californica]|uniref:ribonuclease 1-like n=1 Tax=Aristolochia californica TaxID=171875 RepID=UPI0035DEBBFD
MATHLSAGLFVFFVLCSHSVATIAAKDVDFMYLVLMWPGSYCKQASSGCCLPKSGQPVLDFFIKGLYPASSDGTILSKCQKIPFNANQIDDMKDDLNSYWSNIRCPRSEGRFLWKSVWKNNGVCSGLSQHDYFQRALNLRSKVDLLSILGKQGIISTDYMDYSFNTVLDVVSSGIGANTAIKCGHNAWGESIVYEVHMCVDKNANAIIPCPVLPKNACDERVVLGSFTYDMLQNMTTVNPIRMRILDA